MKTNITITRSRDFGNNPRSRLLVTNLHQNIINSELKVRGYLFKTIFEKVGPLKRCGIHWDNLGNSKGTADVEFFKSEDAKKAVEEFDSSFNV
jgi:RNA recognition motif-containing protein